MADGNHLILDEHSHESAEGSFSGLRPSYQSSNSTIISAHTARSNQYTLRTSSTEQRRSLCSSGGVSSADTFQTAVADDTQRPLLTEEPTTSTTLSSASTNLSTQWSHSQDDLTVYSSEQRYSRSSSSGAESNHTSSRTVVADDRNQYSEAQPRPSYELSSESTPLLHRREDGLSLYGTDQGPPRPPSIASRTPSEASAFKKRSRVPWPTVISLATLTLAVLTILVVAFAAPAAVQEYGQQAAVFKPKSVSIDSTTPDGVRARVQGDFVMDSGRVKNKSVRGIGRLATWIAREIETSPSDVEVYLPEYGNVLVGTAAVPTIKLSIRNGHHTTVDFLTDLEAGDIRGIHAVAIDWIEGRLGRLSVKGKAAISLKSGLISLGTQVLTHNVIFEEADFPALPEVAILKLNVHDTNIGAMAADILVEALIDSPVDLTVPALGFDVLVPNCSPGDPYILVANSTTSQIHVQHGSLQPAMAGVEALIKQLPEELTSSCPGKEDSPLDSLVSSFMQGLETTVYVRGSDAPSPDTPAWMVDLLRSVTVPLPFTGHALDNLVKNFTMSDTHFSLPDPFAEPDSPESQPTVSAVVKVLIALPEEMNFQVDVPKVRALADVFYKDEKFGVLNISKWQDSNSTIVDVEDGSSALLVEFAMKDAPLEVTDDGILAEVIQAMLFGSKGVELRVAATVDTKVSTGLGRFAVRGIPAEGRFPVKTSFGNPLGRLNPLVVSLQLGETTESSMAISTLVNFTNPTQYSATIPFIDLLILSNDTAVAHIVAQNISIVPGHNSYVPVGFLWCPLNSSGMNGVEAGRALLSSYISGQYSHI
ncbi:unnamed protein product [Penicillium salamii]|uniref:Uncharacterized protein n=1 Tax=Penicillium salamii TaxID=1612424 RepID=A0A9W4JBI9_9EURO|nr:unnamed protein product [Penicillium salamii]CAG8103759.1 unnamed protein product [Penicillium salamii]CAG8376541.1 unnamed protein product [Penicillium salamii]CAG8378185.1 unnamed protein product [Penicillium salamii]CAG8379852.1 unnamed protein product [Penicillium salamii]